MSEDEQYKQFKMFYIFWCRMLNGLPYNPFLNHHWHKLSSHCTDELIKNLLRPGYIQILVKNQGRKIFLFTCRSIFFNILIFYKNKNYQIARKRIFYMLNNQFCDKLWRLCSVDVVAIKPYRAKQDQNVAV